MKAVLAKFPLIWYTMSKPLILVVDQGTTSTRALIMNPEGNILGFASEQIQQIFPKDGWVEHSPNQIWTSVQSTIATVLNNLQLSPARIAAIGITNQRETTILWDPETGNPYYNAIVWQDVRTSETCKSMAQHRDLIHQKTGLFPNPYFSATKIQWILNHIPGSGALVKSGRILAGTVDAFLVWKMSGHQQFATDHSNASRTMLMNLKTGKWDKEMLELFQIPASILPAIQPSASSYGVTKNLGVLPDGIPIYGVAGDQQASLVGHRCNLPGMAKCTFGTGAFLLQHTGDKIIYSNHGLLTTVAATLDSNLEYCLEGSVFIAGAAIQFLRDSLGLFNSSADSESQARHADKNTDLLFIPALTGLGTPYWDSNFQGTILGLTRNITKNEITLAALQGVSHQVADLVEETEILGQFGNSILSIDGGMTGNAFFNQCLSDITGIQVVKSANEEMTAIGAGLLAAAGAKILNKRELLQSKANHNEPFRPGLEMNKRLSARNRWKKAISCLRNFYST